METFGGQLDYWMKFVPFVDLMMMLSWLNAGREQPTNGKYDSVNEVSDPSELFR